MMNKPADSASATPPLASQLQLELPAHSKESIIAGLCKLSDSLSIFQRCLTELQLHIGSSLASIHSSSMLLLPHTTNANSLSTPTAALPAPEEEVEEEEVEEDEGEEEKEEEEEVELEDEEETEEDGEVELEEVEEEEEEEGDEDEDEEVELKEEVEEGEEDEEVELEDDEEEGDEDEEVELNEEEEGDEDEDEEVEEEKQGEEVRTPLFSELASICKAMSDRDLNKYMKRHFSNKETLLEQLPKALKLSENPKSLVLKCLNKFYLQRTDSFFRGTRVFLQRKVSVLALECLLLMMVESEGVVEIDETVKEDVNQAALAWKERLMSEGGVKMAHKLNAQGAAHRLDARGLLLLFGCFGVPSFGILYADIRYFLTFGAQGIYGALKRSSVFMEYIPKLIEWRVKCNVVDAVDIAYTFGLEDKSDPLRLLTSFIKESEETLSKKIRGFKQTNTVLAAKKDYLVAVRSVYSCLRRHRIDPSKLITGWQFDVKIMSLEKEIVELNEHVGQETLAELIKNIRDQNLALKRKIDETESSGCFSNKEMKSSYPSNPNPWPRHPEKVVNHVDNSIGTLLEGGGTTGHIYGYSLSPSVLHATVAGSIRENVVGSLPGPVGGVVATVGVGAGAGKSVQGGLCAGVHGLTLVDRTPGQTGSHTGLLYGQRRDAVMYDRLASHSYAYRPSSFLEGSGSMGLPNTITVDTYRSPPYLEASTGLPNTIPGDAYKPPSYLEASTGLSNRIPADAYRPPPYMEAVMRLPNTITSDAYKPPTYLKAVTRLPNTISGDAYKPPSYLAASSGSNTILGGAYRPPPYLESSTGLPNTKPADSYHAPPYLEAYMGLPNTMPADAYSPPPYLKASTGLRNTTSGDAYRPPPYLEGSTGLSITKPMDVAGGNFYI
ncbi:hypothetical protein P3S67_009302 [Capsicum chacoense]|uniref:uncharacterized protein LOC124899359 n=1 Tax=Capsicum annuum TaxID=4072 RepID=UPI001FB161CF|nr:uncharacterized protein LOC124899359 [Capsicum annuum]XP_047270003.1 uncharacterized protein LOC124899359 [Capsicum annuum]XP_047270004.1 uncharacterized protein LOC124899359 [Capsicum annuum]XP_047270005.1 uncharacterized protein LOC124899359 [Capsicum annuum]XP_047270006.1 uncharacterized protein LOC124899359 [Capsicum annuum]XP_047270007.1 uncharacterized protein LOC124899359 [Capsicum annuum]XP_047270008.1 uncharacterized protein LOC124899359 [Capsicum annuum]XP_047270009.1 uncharacte